MTTQIQAEDQGGSNSDGEFDPTKTTKRLLASTDDTTNDVVKVMVQRWSRIYKSVKTSTAWPPKG